MVPCDVMAGTLWLPYTPREEVHDVTPCRENILGILTSSVYSKQARRYFHQMSSNSVVHETEVVTFQ